MDLAEPWESRRNMNVSRGGSNYVVDSSCDLTGAVVIGFHRTCWRRANTLAAGCSSDCTDNQSGVGSQRAGNLAGVRNGSQ